MTIAEEPDRPSSHADPAVSRLISRWDLAPHPEGGYFRRWYASPLVLPPSVLPADVTGPRPSATSILYLLPAGERSRPHRLKSDELWIITRGSPLVIHEFADDPRTAGPADEPARQITLMPPDLTDDAPEATVPTHAVSARTWFGAEVPVVPGLPPYALAVCVVTPGFDFADFEIAPESHGNGAADRI
jgi:predicted cupin superfamily sugar epimerase